MDKDWQCLIIPQGIQFIQLVVTVAVCEQQVKPKLSEECTHAILSNILNHLGESFYFSLPSFAHILLEFMMCMDDSWSNSHHRS